jgi:adenosine deaminase
MLSVLRELEITIESNPSSNLLIMNLLGLEDHPVMTLGPGLPATATAGSPAPPLLLSINSDDPVTFATSLADEYAHLYFALVRRGVAAQEAMRWIDQLRENGWRSRFTLTANADPDILRLLLPE